MFIIDFNDFIINKMNKNNFRWYSITYNTCISTEEKLLLFIFNNKEKNVVVAKIIMIVYFIDMFIIVFNDL
jgi:hypothetical protein